MNRNTKEQHLFEIKLYVKWYVFTVSFDPFYASFLKSIDLFQQKNLTISKLLNSEWSWQQYRAIVFIMVISTH